MEVRLAQYYLARYRTSFSIPQDFLLFRTVQAVQKFNERTRSAGIPECVLQPEGFPKQIYRFHLLYVLMLSSVHARISHVY